MPKQKKKPMQKECRYCVWYKEAQRMDGYRLCPKFDKEVEGTTCAENCARFLLMKWFWCDRGEQQRDIGACLNRMAKNFTCVAGCRQGPLILRLAEEVRYGKS